MTDKGKRRFEWSAPFQDVDMKIIMKSSFLVLLLKVLFALAAFLTSILITRYVGVENSGYYFYLLSLVSILATVSRLGLDSVVTKSIAVANNLNNYHQISYVVNTSLKRVLLASAIIAAVVVLIGGLSAYYELSNVDTIQSYYVTAVLLPFVSCTAIIVSGFQGKKDILTFAFFSGLSKALMLGLISILILFGTLTLQIVYVAFFVATLLTLVLTFYVWKKIEISASDDVEMKGLFELGEKIKKSGYTLWGASILAIIMAQGMQTMTGVIGSTSEAAYIGVALRVSTLVAFVLLAINSVVSPRFAEVYSEGNMSKLQSTYRKTTCIMLIVSFPILTCLYIYSAEVLSIFGNDFLAALPALKVLLVAQFLKVLVGSTGNLLVMSGFEKYHRNSLLFSVLILLCLGGLLIPSYGALGAALATLCAVAVNNFLGLFFVSRKLKITLF